MPCLGIWSSKNCSPKEKKSFKLELRENSDYRRDEIYFQKKCDQLSGEKCKIIPIESIYLQKRNTRWAVSRAPRNYMECDGKQCQINGVEYLFLSFDV